MASFDEGFLSGGGGGAADGDEKAKVSANDTTAGYLNGKLVAGDGIDLTEGSDGGDETLTISVEAVATGWYGDGSDGDLTVATGTTTTLAAEMNYNNVTVEGTGVINCAGYPMKVAGTLTVSASGRVHNGGGAASAGTAGASYGNGMIGNGTTNAAGGAGGTAGGAGTASTNTTNSFGGRGGAGGAATAGGAAGAAGTLSAPGAGNGKPWALPWALIGQMINGTSWLQYRGGNGGGGGGADGANAGGGGGGGGGPCIIAAKTVANSGSIDANGGAGAAGTGGNAGGGGGGGGGVMILVRRTRTGNAPTANGGAAGAGAGTGGAGNAGAAGKVVELVG